MGLPPGAEALRYSLPTEMSFNLGSFIYLLICFSREGTWERAGWWQGIGTEDLRKHIRSLPPKSKLNPNVLGDSKGGIYPHLLMSSHSSSIFFERIESPAGFHHYLLLIVLISISYFILTYNYSGINSNNN